MKKDEKESSITTHIDKNMLIGKDAKIYLDQRTKHVKEMGYKFADFLREEKNKN
ncbi:hypothetical protein [Enterococcus faecium]|uniref:hypothetical protein n=1 Tax=Enterococcus faecium TaxID=1352 RepID=UPI00187C5E24|nr:hypothetical protein [Enterococcus faecium]